MNDDKPTHQERLQRNPHLAGHTGHLTNKNDGGDGGDGGGEASCPAFGYLRGIRDQANAIEFRFRSGNSMWFPYGWLGTWWYDPSEGLLVKFTGDLVYLVLIRGSNLDKPLNEGAVDLLHAGLQRHRVTWIREMSEDEIKTVGESGPTIDSIQVKEFESNSELKEWLEKTASGFLH